MTRAGRTPTRTVTKISTHAWIAAAAAGCMLLEGAAGAAQVATPGSASVASSAPSAHVLFRIPEHDLYPESIAFDSVSGDYFLGSMSHGRILRIHADGSYRDFVTGIGETLQGSIGLKVDAPRRRLWVCTGRYTMFAGDASTPARTGILLFDLDSGALMGEWLQSQPSPAHIFNDLTIAADGSVYATTTLFGRVYRISVDSDAPRLVLETPTRHNNGIALGPDGRRLFLTLDRSISRYDLESGELVDLADPEGASVGTDGLYYRDGSLIVVKPRAAQVDLLRLDESRGSIQGVETLARDDPAFAYPTTGVLVGDTFVFVATSFADRPRRPGARDQHGDVLIYAVSLEGRPRHPAPRDPTPRHATEG